MEKQENNFKKFNDLWRFNLQKINEIHRDIEESLQNLENRYVDFESLYNILDEKIHILSSIYSGYNVIDGNEQILRLIALLASYRQRYTRESINFNLMNKLLIKISDLRDRSFEQFPGLDHDQIIIRKEQQRITRRDYLKRPYKWVTFKRHGSWFIAPYRSIGIRPNDDTCRIMSHDKNDYITIQMDAETYIVKDIFLHTTDGIELPRYYILLDGGNRNYAARQIGKKIYSSTDILAPKVRPYAFSGRVRLSPGRVKIFGINHILLN